MSSWGRFTDSYTDAVRELVPDLSLEKHIELTKRIEKCVESYLEETLDMHFHIWEKLKTQRMEAWQERNKFEKLYLEAKRSRSNER